MRFENIVKNYKLPFDSTWEEWLEGDIEQSHLDKVKRIKEDYIAHNNTLFEPIYLVGNDYDVDEDTGEKEFYPAHVGDGCHRLRMLHELGVKDIPVYLDKDTEHPWVEDMSLYQQEDINFNEKVFRLIYVYPDGEFFEDDKDLELIDYLSFRHVGSLDDAWLDFCISSSGDRGKTIETIIEVPADKKIILEELFNDVAPICERFGCVLASVDMFDYDDNDEEIILEKYSPYS